MARASSVWSVAVAAFMTTPSRIRRRTPAAAIASPAPVCAGDPALARSPTLSGAALADLPVELVDGHRRPRALVVERVVVERPVEVEGDRPLALLVGRRAEGDRAAGAQPAVVGDRARHLVRLGEGAAGLRRAADDPAVAAALELVDEVRPQRALVVLDVDHAVGAAARRVLDPAVAVGGDRRGLGDVLG